MKLHPFPDPTAEQTLPSWRKSIHHAAAIAPLAEVLVSRHFCLLGAGDPNRADFVSSENERRASIERTLPFPSADLDRWTDAMGFSDLLSLYLCSGFQEPAEFPLAHPASSKAASAAKVSVSWQPGRPPFQSRQSDRVHGLP